MRKRNLLLLLTPEICVDLSAGRYVPVSEPLHLFVRTEHNNYILYNTRGDTIGAFHTWSEMATFVKELEEDKVYSSSSSRGIGRH